MKYWLPLCIKCWYWCCTGTQSRTKIVLEEPQDTLVVLILLVQDHSTSLSSWHLLFPISQLFAIIRKSKKWIIPEFKALICWQIVGLIICISHIFKMCSWSLFFPLAEKTPRCCHWKCGWLQRECSVQAVVLQWEEMSSRVLTGLYKTSSSLLSTHAPRKSASSKTTPL